MAFVSGIVKELMLVRKPAKKKKKRQTRNTSINPTIQQTTPIKPPVRKQTKITIGILILIIGIMVVFVTAFMRQPNYDMNLRYAQNTARTRREQIIKRPYTYLLPYTLGHEYVFDDMYILMNQIGPEAAFSLILDLRNEPTDVPEYISYAHAQADIAGLRFIMRLFYGAYNYFGGDDVFTPLFDNIHAILGTADYWSTGPQGTFAALLHEQLFSVISDNHFILGNQILGAPTDGIFDHFVSPIHADFFESPSDFTRTANGFRCLVFNLYVQEIPGHNLNDIFRLSLNESGELVYIAVRYLYGGTEEMIYELPIIYEDGSESSLLLFRHRPQIQAYRYLPTLERINGIPVITMRSMGHTAQDQSTVLVSAFTYAVRNEPIIILDVRSNEGGSSLIPTQIFYNLLGEIVPPVSMMLHIGDEDTQIFSMGYQSRFTGQTIYRPMRPLGPYHMVVDYTPRRIVNNDNLIIILTDRWTGSAAERVVDIALNVRNTLVVGQNTSGVMRGIQGPHSMFMQNSGLPFSFGYGVLFFPDGFGEGVGFAPDIWATGDALDVIMAFLRNEGRI